MKGNSPPVVLDGLQSSLAKAAGQQLAAGNAGDWTATALAELREWLTARAAGGTITMTFEQFRAVAQHHPVSHKAWGALASKAHRAGLIEPDQYVQATAVKTHGHPVMQWRITVGSAA